MHGVSYSRITTTLQRIASNFLAICLFNRCTYDSAHLKNLISPRLPPASYHIQVSHFLVSNLHYQMWKISGALSQRTLTPENTLPQCAIKGNADLYGLGIRLSIYIQYLTILVAAVSGRRLYSKIRTAVLIYAVAILIVVFRNSISGDINALEVPIIQLLVLVQLSAVLPTVWVISPVGWLIYLALAANSAYFVWYWFRGLDNLKRSACADEYAWFFAKVSLYHWYRTFNKVFACFGIIGVLYQIGAGMSIHGFS